MQEAFSEWRADYSWLSHHSQVIRFLAAIGALTSCRDTMLAVWLFGGGGAGPAAVFYVVHGLMVRYHSCSNNSHNSCAAGGVVGAR